MGRIQGLYNKKKKNIIKFSWEVNGGDLVRLQPCSKPFIAVGEVGTAQLKNTH